MKTESAGKGDHAPPHYQYGNSLIIRCFLLSTHHMREARVQGCTAGQLPSPALSSEQKHSYRGGRLKISTSKTFGPTSCPSYSFFFAAGSTLRHDPALHNPLYESHRTVLSCYGVGLNSRQRHLRGQKLLLPFFALLLLEEISSSDKSTVTDIVHFIFYCSTLAEAVVVNKLGVASRFCH